VHNLPGAIFRPKDRRNPQSEWDAILPSTHLGLYPLYPHKVRTLRSYVLRYVLKGNDLAISKLRCRTLQPLSNLLPSTHGRAEGVSEAYVFLMREHPLHGLRVPFRELTQRELTLLNSLVEIIYRRHSEITSIVGTSAFPKATTLFLPVGEPLKRLALFT
jgi:hypothetical protein